jgi:hypothetical protein
MSVVPKPWQKTLSHDNDLYLTDPQRDQPCFPQMLSQQHDLYSMAAVFAAGTEKNGTV